MTGNPSCPLCNGKGMLTTWERRKRKWSPVPQSPCLCLRKIKWGRCGLCNDVVTGEERIGAALCDPCAKAIADSTNLELKEKA
jgi:hypothetical protein